MIHENDHDFQPEIPVENPRAFLAQFPPARRGPISNWFHYAVRNGATTPAAVLEAVRQTSARHRLWRGEASDAALADAALASDPAGALAYAQHVLEYEHLPPAERQRTKAERAVFFLTESMRQKPVTAPQLAYLTALGHTGAPPANRAEASVLIDRLRRERRGA